MPIESTGDFWTRLSREQCEAKTPKERQDVGETIWETATGQRKPQLREGVAEPAPLYSNVPHVPKDSKPVPPWGSPAPVWREDAPVPPAASLAPPAPSGWVFPASAHEWPADVPLKDKPTDTADEWESKKCAPGSW
jgi:hypothetical protein